MPLERAPLLNKGVIGVSGPYAGIGGFMRIRMIKVPSNGNRDLEGFDLSRFEVGHVYEIGPRLAELLIVCGYAEPEMRKRDRAADRSKSS